MPQGNRTRLGLTNPAARYANAVLRFSFRAPTYKPTARVSLPGYAGHPHMTDPNRVDVYSTAEYPGDTYRAIDRSAAGVGTRSHLVDAFGPDQAEGIEFLDYPFTVDGATFEDHLDAVRRVRPSLTVAPDIERGRDPADVYEQADQLLQYADAVVVVPKDVSPAEVPDRFRVGVPLANFGHDDDAQTALDDATEGVPDEERPPTTHQLTEYADANEVHLLGGSPTVQFEAARHFLPVASVDTAAVWKGADFGNVWVDEGGGRWQPTPSWSRARRGAESLTNMAAAWADRRGYDGPDPADLPFDKFVENPDPAETRGPPPCQVPDCGEDACAETAYTYCTEHINVEEALGWADRANEQDDDVTRTLAAEPRAHAQDRQPATDGGQELPHIPEEWHGWEYVEDYDDGDAYEWTATIDAAGPVRVPATFDWDQPVEARVSIINSAGRYAHRWTARVKVDQGDQQNVTTIAHEKHTGTEPDDGRVKNLRRAVDKTLGWMEENPASTTQTMSNEDTYDPTSEFSVDDRQGALDVGVDQEESSGEKQVTLGGSNVGDDSADLRPDAWRQKDAMVAHYYADDLEAKTTSIPWQEGEWRVVVEDTSKGVEREVATELSQTNADRVTEAFVEAIDPPDVSFKSDDNATANAAAEAKKAIQNEDDGQAGFEAFGAGQEPSVEEEEGELELTLDDLAEHVGESLKDTDRGMGLGELVDVDRSAGRGNFKTLSGKTVSRSLDEVETALGGSYDWHGGAEPTADDSDPYDPLAEYDVPAEAEDVTVGYDEGGNRVVEWHEPTDEDADLDEADAIIRAALRSDAYGHWNSHMRAATSFANAVDKGKKEATTPDGQTVPADVLLPLYDLKPEEWNLGGINRDSDDAHEKALAVIAWGETGVDDEVARTAFEDMNSGDGDTSREEAAERVEELERVESLAADPPETVNGWELADHTDERVQYVGGYDGDPARVVVEQDGEAFYGDLYRLEGADATEKKVTGLAVAKETLGEALDATLERVRADYPSEGIPQADDEADPAPFDMADGPLSEVLDDPDALRSPMEVSDRADDDAIGASYDVARYADQDQGDDGTLDDDLDAAGVYDPLADLDAPEASTPARQALLDKVDGAGEVYDPITDRTIDTSAEGRKARWTEVNRYGNPDLTSATIEEEWWSRSMTKKEGSVREFRLPGRVGNWVRAPDEFNPGPHPAYISAGEWSSGLSYKNDDEVLPKVTLNGNAGNTRAFVWAEDGSRKTLKFGQPHKSHEAAMEYLESTDPHEVPDTFSDTTDVVNELDKKYADEETLDELEQVGLEPATQYAEADELDDDDPPGDLDAEIGAWTHSPTTSNGSRYVGLTDDGRPVLVWSRNIKRGEWEVEGKVYEADDWDEVAAWGALWGKIPTLDESFGALGHTLSEQTPDEVAESFHAEGAGNYQTGIGVAEGEFPWQDGPNADKFNTDDGTRDTYPMAESFQKVKLTDVTGIGGSSSRRIEDQAPGVQTLDSFAFAFSDGADPSGTSGDRREAAHDVLTESQQERLADALEEYVEKDSRRDHDLAHVDELRHGVYDDGAAPTREIDGDDVGTALDEEPVETPDDEFSMESVGTALTDDRPADDTESVADAAEEYGVSETILGDWHRTLDSLNDGQPRGKVRKALARKYAYVSETQDEDTATELLNAVQQTTTANISGKYVTDLASDYNEDDLGDLDEFAVDEDEQVDDDEEPTDQVEQAEEDGEPYDPTGEPVVEPFRTRGEAKTWREDHEEHLHPENDNRTKTVKVDPDAPDHVLESLEREALSSRESEGKTYGQTELSDRERKELEERESFKAWKHLFHAQSVKAILEAEGVNFMDHYDPTLPVEYHRKNVEEFRADVASGGKGLSTASEEELAASRSGHQGGLDMAKADAIEEDAGATSTKIDRGHGRMCQSARDACEDGEDNACDVLLKDCGYDAPEVESIRGAIEDMGEEPDAVLMDLYDPVGEYDADADPFALDSSSGESFEDWAGRNEPDAERPSMDDLARVAPTPGVDDDTDPEAERKAMEETLPGPAVAALGKAWSGYSLARQEHREAQDRAERYAEVINGIRAVHGQAPLTFDRLDGWAGGEVVTDDPEQTYPTEDGEVTLDEAAEAGTLSEEADRQTSLGRFTQAATDAATSTPYDPLAEFEADD